MNPDRETADFYQRKIFATCLQDDAEETAAARLAADATIHIITEGMKRNVRQHVISRAVEIMHLAERSSEFHVRAKRVTEE